MSVTLPKCTWTLVCDLSTWACMVVLVWLICGSSVPWALWSFLRAQTTHVLFPLWRVRPGYFHVAFEWFDRVQKSSCGILQAAHAPVDLVRASRASTWLFPRTDQIDSQRKHATCIGEIDSTGHVDEGEAGWVDGSIDAGVLMISGHIVIALKQSHRNFGTLVLSCSSLSSLSETSSSSSSSSSHERSGYLFTVRSELVADIVMRWELYIGVSLHCQYGMSSKCFSRKHTQSIYSGVSPQLQAGLHQSRQHTSILMHRRPACKTETGMLLFKVQALSSPISTHFYSITKRITSPSHLLGKVRPLQQCLSGKTTCWHINARAHGKYRAERMTHLKHFHAFLASLETELDLNNRTLTSSVYDHDELCMIIRICSCIITDLIGRGKTNSSTCRRRWPLSKKRQYFQRLDKQWSGVQIQTRTRKIRALLQPGLSMGYV